VRPAIDTMTTPGPRLGSMRQAKTRKARARSAGKEKAHRVTRLATAFSRRVSVRALLQASRKASPKGRDGAPGGARVVGRATRTDVATRSRFGRGARHRTIRLRGPPASGARRLPALHRACRQGGRPPRRKTASALPIGGRRRPPSTRVIRIFVTELMINVNKIVTTAAGFQPSILEKSATARVAARIWLSSLSRFSRSGLPSTLTVTLSKKASM